MITAGQSRRSPLKNPIASSSLVSRRLAGEPVARILGRKEFWGIIARILSPETLVPRPDTETVVELALEMLRKNPRTARPPAPHRRSRHRHRRVLLALLSELPDAHRDRHGHFGSASLRALKTMPRDLGYRHAQASFVAITHPELTGPFDLIVSNSPYVRDRRYRGPRPARSATHDPLQALDGGPDGLAAYRALIPQAAQLLAGGAALVVEAGQGQARDIEALMTAAGLTPQSPPRADLAGIFRAVGARKMPR